MAGELLHTGGEQERLQVAGPAWDFPVGTASFLFPSSLSWGSCSEKVSAHETQMYVL